MTRPDKVIQNVIYCSEHEIAVNAKNTQILLEYIKFLERDRELLCDELESVRMNGG